MLGAQRKSPSKSMARALILAEWTSYGYELSKLQRPPFIHLFLSEVTPFSH